VFAINVLVVSGLVLSYLLATFNAGNTIMFLILRKVRDGENLLTRQEPDSQGESGPNKTNGSPTSSQPLESAQPAAHV
jgi:hypothetical protein